MTMLGQPPVVMYGWIASITILREIIAGQRGAAMVKVSVIQFGAKWRCETNLHYSKPMSFIVDNDGVIQEVRIAGYAPNVFTVIEILKYVGFVVINNRRPQCFLAKYNIRRHLAAIYRQAVAPTVYI